MPSGVSSIKPLGAAENPGSVGAAAWQGTQRSATMCCTAENSAAGGDSATLVEGAARGASAAAAAARTSTPSSAGQGEVLPPRRWRLWRSTKYARINTPAALIAINTSQFWRAPNVRA